MAGDEDIPTLASLRRGVKRKQSASAGVSKPLAEHRPSLFDFLPVFEAPVKTASAQPPATVTPERSVQSPTPVQSVVKPELSKPRVWSVAALVREVRGFVERNYGQVTVEGEISNWRPAGSGHCYFTLKDGDAQLSAVMFRRQASLLRFQPKDGDSVRLRGQISVYENRGQMQIIAEAMELAGQGALLAAVQQLKERLRREGLFERKRPLPAFPSCIGVVTSLQGAALRDIVKVCRRRHAAVNLLVYPASVQGPRCAAEVTAGLRWFSKHSQRVDVVIVARGGGSWEDLHGFDDEGVIRAIVGCKVPVIAGIGHATDTTIADAAADVCAPTPSAAAELVTAAQHRIEERVERLHARIERAGRYELLRARQRFWNIRSEVGLRYVRDALRQREQHLDELSFRASQAMARLLRLRRELLRSLDLRLGKQNAAARLGADKEQLQVLQFKLQSVAHTLTGKQRRAVDHCAFRLDALSPLRVLERGYALVYGPDDKLLRSTSDIQRGDTFTARLNDGMIDGTVARLRSTSANSQEA